ncbi:hypothetical protein [Pelagibius sp.]|uniref:hypothetical protein n=1 Tax=Pelagibius sp. TaxID=1931238 RepID=UPI003BAE19C6
MKRRDAAIPKGAPLALRLVLILGGGYLLAAGASGLAAAALAKAMPRAEAVMLMAMLVFVVYLGLLLWGFAERRPARLWAVFGAGGVAVFALAKTIGAAGGV